MNIGIDVRCLMTLQKTGVAEYTRELLHAIFSEDSENQYYLFYNSKTSVSKNVRQWQQSNVHYVETRVPNKFFNASLKLFGYPALDTLIKKKEGIPELDWFFSPNVNFSAFSKKTKHILTVHDLSFELLPDCYSRKRRWWHTVIAPQRQCAQASIVLTPSESTKNNVIKHYDVDRSKVHVITPGLSSLFAGETITTTEIKAKYGLPDNYILYLGTLEPRKNINGIIEAFSMCGRAIHSGYELIIAGGLGWHYKEILNKINESPHVRYIGYIDNQEKPALYTLADLFVFPSLYEGFGFPVLEAMASGVPVITSNRSSLPEVTGNAAYLVNPMNILDIKNAIETILDDKDLQKRLIGKGLKRATELSWEHAAQDFLSLLKTYENRN